MWSIKTQKLLFLIFGPETIVWVTILESQMKKFEFYISICNHNLIIGSKIWKFMKGNEVYCNLDKHFLLSISQLCLQTSKFDRNWDFYEIWDFMKSHFVRKWQEFDLLRKYYVIKHAFVFHGHSWISMNVH